MEKEQELHGEEPFFNLFQNLNKNIVINIKSAIIDIHGGFTTANISCTKNGSRYPD